MTLKTILTSAEKFVTDNSPGILTGLAVAGTVTTVVLTGHAAYSAALLIAHEWEPEAQDLGERPSIKEKAQLVWKEFVPAAISGTATITCIIMANQIGSRRSAAIAAAFKLSEALTEEYKDRVVKTLGAKKEETLRSELAKERMERTGGSDLIIVAGSEALFFDELSGRFFKKEMETVRKSVNDINYKINNYMHASLSDFYEMIGLPSTSFSDEVGWNTDKLLDVKYAAVLLDDGRAAISIDFQTTPIRGYDRLQ